MHRCNGTRRGRAAAIVAVASLVCCPASFAQPAKKKPIRSAAEPAACAKLHVDYEMANKRLALYWAQGAVMGGAAKMRAEQQSTSTMSEASMTLDLMRGNRCKLPTSAPSRERYGSAGMQCVRDMIGANGRPDSCILENWTPDK